MQLKSTTAFQLDAVESDLKGFTYSSSVTTSTIRRALLQTVTTYVTVQLCYIYKENSLSSYPEHKYKEFSLYI